MPKSSILGFVLAMAGVAFVTLVVYTVLRRVLRRRRPYLILKVRNDVARALKALTDFSADLYLPDDIRPEFERRRMRLQETLDAMLAFALSVKNARTPDAFSFWWEELLLRGSLWVLRRFTPVTLNTFRRETMSRLCEWAVHAESAAGEQYLLAEEYALRLPREPVCQMALTSLLPARKELDAAAARVLRPPEGTEPAAEDVQRLDRLTQDIRRWSALIQSVNQTPGTSRTVDSPVGQPRRMMQ